MLAPWSTLQKYLDEARHGRESFMTLQDVQIEVGLSVSNNAGRAYAGQVPIYSLWNKWSLEIASSPISFSGYR